MGHYMPPTAKLAFNSSKMYDVFLSFRGPDVRKSLVDHLYEALSAAGLNVFLDSEKLEKGEIIELGLERAIQSSSIHIPVFSKGYADSVWCLREATAMVKTSCLIIPLFYYVDPTHVRYPRNDSSPYKQSFDKHYGRPDRHAREEVDDWKNALLQICSRSGWSMDLTQGSEDRLVKKVVHDLFQILDRVPLEVAKHPVGVDSIQNALIKELHLNSVNEVVKLGIWGIGGIGKTTIAKALYNQLYADFEAASFIFNVRMTAADPKGLRDLQRKILKDLCKYHGEVDSIEEGKSLLRYRLGGIRVLLIVDDVDDVQQLDALVGDWLAPHSRVIITSRDKHILNIAQVQCIREMSGLEMNEALQLFSWHAFLRACPSPSYEDMSKKIVEACKGHPLSLEVIGSLLYDNKDYAGCWNESLSNITLQPGIHERLKVSYDSLSEEEKEIFLDIACFFNREVKTSPIVFWKSMYKMVDTAIFNLSMKSLIKIDDKGLFDMHDHLRDMGRTIAKTEKKGTRLWEATHLSTLYKTTNISRLQLNKSSPQRPEMFCNLDLSYLNLQNLSIGGMTEDTLATIPPSLIWLRLEHCTFAMGMDTAVTLPRHSRFVENIWQLKTIGYLSQLQVLDLKWCKGLNILPDTIGNLSQLQILDLFDCKGLKILPDAIGNLSQLQLLELTGCEGLKFLPDTIGSLSQLQVLNLKWCNGLDILPEAIGNLSQLQVLNLKWCNGLDILPEAIGNLSQLETLDLFDCKGLKILPDTIGNLSQLQLLELTGCEGLKFLPDTIGNLSLLPLLNLKWCKGLNILPQTIGNLSQLQTLDLFDCKGLKMLPDTIGNLSQLQLLELTGCEGLKFLPDTIGNLSLLPLLNLKWCKGLNILPQTIGNLSKLQTLDLFDCKGLKILPDTIGNLSQLHLLELAGCEGLKILPDTIGNLSQLQVLNLKWCKGLNILPHTIGILSQLQTLDLFDCKGLKILPHTIDNLSQLQLLELTGCGGLKFLPDTIGNLSQLQILNLKWCKGLDILPETIGNLSQLKTLDLFDCKGLKIIPGTIGNLSQLQLLELTGCEGLKILPDTIGNLSQLQILDLKWCKGLNILPDTLGKLSQLQYLHISYCEGLKILPETISNLSQLQHLDISQCNIIDRPPRIGNLSDEHSAGVYTLPGLES